ncbi:MAG: hypothetical protein ACREFH_11420 [Stellaceae bacterium]
MRGWTMAAAAAALLAAGLWHWPATAQKAPPTAATQAVKHAAPQPAAPKPAAPKPVAPLPITFAEYRDFRLQAMARRQAQLARQLAAPDLSAVQKATLEGKKAYYDRIAAMSADDRDKLYRARFGQIDTDHDGTIDEAERASWREKQHAYYAQLAAGRAGAGNTSH